MASGDDLDDHGGDGGYDDDDDDDRDDHLHPAYLYREKYFQISSPVAVALAGTALPLSLLLSAPLFLHTRLEVDFHFHFF